MSVLWDNAKLKICQNQSQLLACSPAGSPIGPFCPHFDPIVAGRLPYEDQLGGTEPKLGRKRARGGREIKPGIVSSVARVDAVYTRPFFLISKIELDTDQRSRSYPSLPSQSSAYSRSQENGCRLEIDTTFST